MKIQYGVTIDNGDSYCGGLPGRFETEEAATQAGENWLQEFYIDNEISPEEQEWCEAGFDVFEEEVADPEEMEELFDPIESGWVGKDGRP